MIPFSYINAIGICYTDVGMSSQSHNPSGKEGNRFIATSSSVGSSVRRDDDTFLYLADTVPVKRRTLGFAAFAAAGAAAATSLAIALGSGGGPRKRPPAPAEVSSTPSSPSFTGIPENDLTHTTLETLYSTNAPVVIAPPAKLLQPNLSLKSALVRQPNNALVQLDSPTVYELPQVFNPDGTPFHPLVLVPKGSQLDDYLRLLPGGGSGETVLEEGTLRGRAYILTGLTSSNPQLPSPAVPANLPVLVLDTFTK